MKSLDGYTPSRGSLWGQAGVQRSQGREEGSGHGVRSPERGEHCEHCGNVHASWNNAVETDSWGRSRKHLALSSLWP